MQPPVTLFIRNENTRKDRFLQVALKTSSVPNSSLVQPRNLVRSTDPAVAPVWTPQQPRERRHSHRRRAARDAVRHGPQASGPGADAPRPSTGVRAAGSASPDGRGSGHAREGLGAARSVGGPAARTHLQGGAHVLQQPRGTGPPLPVALEQAVLPGPPDDLRGHGGTCGDAAGRRWGGPPHHSRCPRAPSGRCDCPNAVFPRLRKEAGPHWPRTASPKPPSVRRCGQHVANGAPATRLPELLTPGHPTLVHVNPDAGPPRGPCPPVYSSPGHEAPRSIRCGSHSVLKRPSPCHRCP